MCESLNKLKQVLDYLCKIDMLDFILKDELFHHLYDELVGKYLIDIDSNSVFSDIDIKVRAIKSNIVQWFGEDFILGFKDGEYYFLSLETLVDDTKYWKIFKMQVDNLETAKNIGNLLVLLNEI